MADVRTRIAKDGKPRYTARIRIKGHPPESKTFTRKTDMNRWIQSTEAAIRERRYFPRARTHKYTVKEACERYAQSVLPHKKPSTRVSQEPQLEWWKDQLGDVLLVDVTPQLLNEYKEKLFSTERRQGKADNKQELSSATVGRYLSLFSHVLSLCAKEWNWIDSNPMQRVSMPKEPRGRTRFLSDEERQVLLAECKKSQCDCLYVLVVIALSTGMRKGEIINLRWKDVDFKRGEITLHDTKAGECRVVPLVGHAYELMQERSKVRRIDTDLCFPAPTLFGKDAKPYDIGSGWKWALKRAKINDFRFHDLRHSCASYLAMQGRSLTEVGALLGHKQAQTTARYSHLAKQHLSALAADLNAQLFENKNASDVNAL